MLLVDDGLAVELPRVERPRLEDFTGLFRLGNPGRSRVARRPLAPVQVEQDDVVAEVRVPRDRAAATIFRIARMTTSGKASPIPFVQFFFSLRKRPVDHFRD